MTYYICNAICRSVCLSVYVFMHTHTHTLQRVVSLGAHLRRELLPGEPNRLFRLGRMLSFPFLLGPCTRTPD